MVESTAQQEVRKTFKASFDKTRFRNFVNEICHGFDELKAQAFDVPNAFTDHVKSCQRLGTYEAPNGELADILIVNLTDAAKLERTRTGLRDFVAHKLKRGDSYKEAALVAFVAPDHKSWRFSYVRMEYDTKRDPKTGKIKPEERLTPARRFSYLVGEEEECHTAQSRFLPLLQNTEEAPTLEAIEKAFSVEAVTDEFFDEYARLFDETNDAVKAVLKRDSTLRSRFAAKSIQSDDFAKKLLGQIIFLYFIQKKGWLGVPKGEPWGEGKRNFLRQLCNDALESSESFFSDYLEPLFYDSLATDRGHAAWYEALNCRIPFLNGGLFEPLDGYDWKRMDVPLPNELFSNKHLSEQGDTGTGILDIFDRYNFTVNEAEPLEKEVAIDPEMLGKVFENLIEENLKKGRGAFYTRREIVHYMCQETLIEYLENGLNHPVKPMGEPTPSPSREIALFVDSTRREKRKKKQLEFTDTGRRALVSRDDLADWILKSEQYAHYEAVRVRGTRIAKEYEPPEAIKRYALEIDNLLRDIAVCDPAAGSGAYPVGMMMEIVRARRALTPYFNDIADRTTYYLKRHAIQNCLYGVDIDPGAVEIARLRLWLSLVVDEEEVNQIKPLPNLDYKIVCGNSLIGVERTLLNSEDFHRLEKIKPKYFNESDHARKEALRVEIEKMIHHLTEGKTIFDFEIYFSEVFHEKGGFDVVIGNPPYVRHEDIDPELKEQLQGRYEVAGRSNDLLTYFYELGYDLLGNRGVLAMITSNKFMRATYGKKLKAFLKEKTTLLRMLDFGDMHVFAAMSYPVIVVLRKNPPKRDAQFLGMNVTEYRDIFRLPEAVSTRAKSIPQSELDPAAWRIESRAKARLMEKLKSKGTPLGEYVEGKFYYGIKTGFNKAFVIDAGTRRELIREDKNSAKLIKPFLRGKDIKRYSITDPNLFLIFTRRGVDIGAYPAIKKYLGEFKESLMPRPDDWDGAWPGRNAPEDWDGKWPGRKAGSCKWYEIQDSIDYWREFEKPKIIYPNICHKPEFVHDAMGYYTNQKCFIIPTPDLHLVGLFNSSLSYFVFSAILPKLAGGFFEPSAVNFTKFPIPHFTPESQKRLGKLVGLIQNSESENKSAHTEEIDEVVFRLFDLTPLEIALVREVAAEAAESGGKVEE